MTVPLTDADELLLERVLLPLTEEEKAIEFLRQVMPNLLAALRNDLLRASEAEQKRYLERVHEIAQRVKRAGTLDELHAVADPFALPSLLYDPQAPLWQSWGRADLHTELAQALQERDKARSLLKAAKPGTLTYPQLQKRVEEAEKHLFEVSRKIALAWLDKQADDVRKSTFQAETAEWRAETRLQIPLVVGDHIVDYLDAEITVTLVTPRAFITRTFAVVVISSSMGIIPALRRINLIRHYLPKDEQMIVVTTDPDHIRVLQQHEVYVYLARENNVGSDPTPVG